jgi:PadR family transcriptional regulator PadR
MGRPTEAARTPDAADPAPPVPAATLSDPTAGEASGGLLPRNYLRPCLLLLLAEGTAHGYELLEQVHTLGLTSADAARVYRCLRTLDEEGLVRSRWEPSTIGPARRTYELTASGRRQLGVLTQDVVRTALTLQRFLTRAAGLSDRDGDLR